MENDRRESAMKLIQANNISAKTVHATLHEDLQLSKSQPSEQSNRFMRRRRRPPWLFDHLGQHVLTVNELAGAKSEVEAS